VTLTFDQWPWKSIGLQILLRTKYVPSLVNIHWRVLILECSQGCYRRKEGRTDGSVTISLRNFVGEGMIMVFNAIFNNISVLPWQSVLLVEVTGVSGENHWPSASHWQTLLHNVVLSTLHHERELNSQH
jgi:hypothetical protein